MSNKIQTQKKTREDPEMKGAKKKKYDIFGGDYEITVKVEVGTDTALEMTYTIDAEELQEHLEAWQYDLEQFRDGMEIKPDEYDDNVEETLEGWEDDNEEEGE